MTLFLVAMSYLEKNILNGQEGTDSKQVSLAKRIYNFGSKYVNYKMGLIGSGIMGGMVFGINYYGAHELIGASTAALKQAGSTFLFGGAVMKGCEYLATKISNRAKAITASIVIPSIASILLVYDLHSMKGTPKPVESTIPTAITVIPATAVFGYKKRRHLDSLNSSLLNDS